MQKTKLDKEEQDILDSFERGEWKPASNRRQEIARHVAYARNTLAKDRRVKREGVRAGHSTFFVTGQRGNDGMLAW